MARTLHCFLVAVALAFAIAQSREATAQDNLVPPGYYGNGASNGLPDGGYDPNVGAPYGPSAPARPTNPSRPASWPGGDRDAANRGPLPAAGEPYPAQMPAATSTVATVPEKDPTQPPYEPAAILARAGNEVVQAADILPAVHQQLEAHVAKVGDEFKKLPPEKQEEMLLEWQRQLVPMMLQDMISIKLLLSEIKAAVPEEAVNKNIERIRKEFNDSEMRRLMAVYKATSVIDLENKLRAHGGSLDSQRNMFVEKYMATGWLRQQVKDRKEPTHEQMVSYYREHGADWEKPARARWEQLTAKFDKFPTKAEAWRAVAAWGNDVQRGVPLAQVAKARSQSFSAEEGGLNDWTTKDSLRSQPLDRALFTLPVGQLSQIVEDEEGFHIVRVVEREELRRIPFSEVQPQIKKKIEAGDERSGMNQYLAKLRERTPVSSVFDEKTAAVANRPGQPTR